MLSSCSVCIRELLEEPALRLLSMHLKYAPWKAALSLAWKESSSMAVFRSRPRSPDARAARLLHVLRRVCAARSNQGGDAPWAASVGKNVSHCSGPLATCVALGVIKKVGKAKKSKAKEQTPKVPQVRGVAVSRSSTCLVLRLGVGSGCYRLCTIGESIVARRRLRSWVALADGVGEIIAPRTCQQWISAYTRVHEVTHSTKPYHLKPVNRWFAPICPLPRTR